MILNFDEPLSITVMSPVACVLAGTSQKYDDYRNAARVVVFLLQDEVEVANGDADGTLALQFHSGGRLDIYDDSKQYESYIIRNGGAVIVV
jgi:hypothetical protein